MECWGDEVRGRQRNEGTIERGNDEIKGHRAVSDEWGVVSDEFLSW